MEGELPLENKAVHKLIFQAVFHVGALSENGDEVLSFHWKNDLYDTSLQGFVPTASAIFKHLADILCETPSSYPSTDLLGTLGNFLSEFKANVKDISSRRLGFALCEWSDEVNAEIQLLPDNRLVSSLKLKQCVLLRYSLLCFAGGALIDADIEKIVALVIRCRNLCLHDKSDTKEVVAVESRCLEVMSARLDEIRACVDRNPDFLTQAVSQTINGCPDKLKWTCFTGLNAVHKVFYEARGNGCVYTVNILTGVLLVDGLPPGSLPTDILNHDLYRRVFGSKNFEVVLKNGIHETTRLVAERIYRFFLIGNRLYVLEVNPATGEEYELLDSGTATKSWGMELQPRLKEMYSH